MDLDKLRPDIDTRVVDVVRDRLTDTITRLRAKAHSHAPGRPARQAGYQIQAADTNEAVIRIYDEIWWLGVNAEDLAADLDRITAPTIRVEINSPGGDVFDGIAIYNALRAHPAHITTRVDGIAASIASVIAQAGDRRVMLTGSQMMIHNAWGITIGDRHDHADMSQMLDHQDHIIAGIYASRSGGDIDHLASLMDAETWMSHDRAVDEGLADEVLDLPPDPAPTDRTSVTLHDEISRATDVVAGAIKAAERVAALRADAGKNLSVVNRDSLAGLRDAMAQLDSLLAGSRPADGETDELRRQYARFVATIQGVNP